MFLIPAKANPEIVSIGFHLKEISSTLPTPCSRVCYENGELMFTLKAKGWIVWILLWSRVIFFKFVSPLKA
jgi:hypothetical protein